MAINITITEDQYRRIKSSQRTNVIINESQLDVIREFENHKVLHDEFENKVRGYMEQLFNNPCKPKYDDFFDKHDIPEDILQNKMLDLGLIKKSEKINEPNDANGKKHSVHSVRYSFSNNQFDDKIDKLYNTFFDNKGERLLKETDCGGAIGGDAGLSGPSEGGATNAEGVGGQYTVPFGGIMRRKIGTGTSGNTESELNKQANFDVSPALSRNTKKGIAVNQA